MADDLWANIFGSGFDTYPWWREVRFDEGSSWDTPGVATVIVDDPDNVGATLSVQVTEAMLREALLVCRHQNKVDPCTGHALLPDGDWDADGADVLMQIVCLGQETYA